VLSYFRSAPQHLHDYGQESNYTRQGCGCEERSSNNTHELETQVKDIKASSADKNHGTSGGESNRPDRKYFRNAHCLNPRGCLN
jgi:hypothetical protein